MGFLVMKVVLFSVVLCRCTKNTVVWRNSSSAGRWRKRIGQTGRVWEEV